MLKRIFWLALAVAAGWLIWMRLRRQDDFATMAPQFAPQPFGGLAVSLPPTAPSEPARGDRAEAPGAGTPDEPQHQAVLDAPQAQAPNSSPTASGSSSAAANQPPEAPETTGPAEAPVAAVMTTANENERATAAASNVVVPANSALPEEVIGYCMRCKTKRPIKDAHQEITESGRPSARGTCPVCGANMFTFLKDEGT